jgi:transforming growth factor-beta-induced protein
MKRTLKVLVAGFAASALLVAAPMSASAQDGEDSITAIASGEATLSTVVTALTLAELAGALDDCSYGPVTVFAPVDSAFAALPAETLGAALADPSGLLTQILLYHVVPGSLDAAAVTSSTSLTTAQGGTISVSGAVLNGNINIIATDIAACNGIVHLIDGVLIPTLADETHELPETGVSSTVTTMALGALVLFGGSAMLVATRRRITV